MKLTTKEMTLTAIFMSLTFIVTRFIQIPIPLGYFNIGNVVILCSCVLLPSPCGILVGSLASALADLTSFPVYTLPTLIIKALMPIMFYALCKGVPSTIRRISAAAVATLIPLFGYTLTGMIIAGSIYSGFVQFPGLLLEFIANLILFSLLLHPVIQLKILMKGK